jgi:hypothetical protein
VFVTSTLKMEAVCSLETLVLTYKIARSRTTGDQTSLARFEFRPAVTMKRTFFWSVTSYSLVEVHRYFGGHASSSTFRVEESASMDLLHRELSILLMFLMDGRTRKEFLFLFSKYIYISTRTKPMQMGGYQCLYEATGEHPMA